MFNCAESFNPGEVFGIKNLFAYQAGGVIRAILDRYTRHIGEMYIVNVRSEFVDDIEYLEDLVGESGVSHWQEMVGKELEY